MYGKLRLCPFFLLLCAPFFLAAQPAVNIPMALEELLYRIDGEQIPEEVADLYEKSKDLLINLNLASREQLEESGLFTPFQVHQLIKYRKRFGAFYSIYELAVLPGFHKSNLQVLQTFLEFHTEPDPPERKSSQQLLMVDFSHSHPKSIAYREEPEGGGDKIYAGSPLHAVLRIRSRVGDRLSAGMTYEKDAGERAFYQKRPEFVSAYLAYSSSGIMKQLVAGTFQLNHGLGLVNGTGFFHQLSSFRVNQRMLSMLRPCASKTEQRYERGAACRLSWNNMQILCWASYTLEDLSRGSLRDGLDETNWWDQRRTSGLHRTAGELEGRDLANRFFTGLQFLYRQKKLALGIMFGTERWAMNKERKDSLDGSFLPGFRHMASMHANWLSGSWNFYGECAIENGSSLAFQGGVLVQFNDFMHGNFLVYHYDREYHGIHPYSYPSGIHPENEQGLAFHLHLETGQRILAELSGEIVHYPSPRYRCLVPSEEYRLGITLKNPGTDHIQWRIRLRSKMWQSTPDDGTKGIRPTVESGLNRLDMRFRNQASKSLEWQSRLVISFLSSTLSHKPAYAFVQEAGFHFLPCLQGRAQFVLFHVEDWENRIYLYEPGFYYNLRFPSYYGRGQKTTFLLRLKAFGEWTFSAKVSVTHFHDKTSMGSGNDLVLGNKRWETGFQIRLNL